MKMFYKFLILSMVIVMGLILQLQAQLPNLGKPIKIGMHFPAITSDIYGPCYNFIFTNQFLGSRYDGKPNPMQNPGDFTPDGWPTSDISLRMPNVIAGEVYVEAIGVVDISIGAGSVAGVKLMQSYDVTAKKTIARFDMTAGTFFLRFSNVRSAAIKHIKVFYSNDVTGTGSAAVPKANLKTFRQPVYDALKPYKAVDFYRALEPDLENNGELNWEKRTLPDLQQVAMAELSCDRGSVFSIPGNPNYIPSFKGLAYEHIIDFANETGKDVWMYVPIGASDIYILNLALLVKSRLTSTTAKVYVSLQTPAISRPNYFYNLNLAKTELAAKTTDISFDSLTNEAFKYPYDDRKISDRRYLARNFEIADIFREVFGVEKMMTRIRPVFEIYGEDFQSGLDYLNYKTQNPEQYFYAVIANKYYDAADGPAGTWNGSDCGCGMTNTGNFECVSGSTINVNEVIDRLTYSKNQILGDSYLFRSKTIATWLNMKLLLRNSGPRVHAWCLLQGGKLQSLTDPRMENLQTSYYQEIWKTGVEEANYESVVGSSVDNRNGLWNSLSGAATDSTLDGINLLPKYKGLKTALAATSPGIIMGAKLNPSGNTIVKGGWHFDNYSEFVLPGGWFVAPNDARYAESKAIDQPYYMVVSEGDDNTYREYELTLDVRDDGQFELWLNNRKIADFTSSGGTTVERFASGFSTSNKFKVKLKPGQSTFRVVNKTGNASIVNFNFKNATTFTPQKFTVVVYGGSILYEGVKDSSNLKINKPATMLVKEGSNLIILAQDSILDNGFIDYSNEFHYWKPLGGDSLLHVNSFVGSNGVYNSMVAVHVSSNLTFKAQLRKVSKFSILLENGALFEEGTGINKNEFYPRQRVKIQAYSPFLDSADRLLSVFDRWEGDSKYIPIYYNGASYIENPLVESTLVFMPKKNIYIKALYRKDLQYRLKVINGSPSNTYSYEGTKITIYGDLTNQGFNFKCWKWYNDTISKPLTSYVNDIYAPITFVTQPNRDMEIVAVYDGVSDTSLHEVTAINGWLISGGVLNAAGTASSGIYKSNAKVKMVAFSPEMGSTLVRWKASPADDAIYVEDMTKATTYLTIPDGASGKRGLSFEAIYEPESNRFTLKVIDGITDNGTPEGYFKGGDTVVIGANIAGLDTRFGQWEALDYFTGELLPANQVKIADPFADATYMIMPGKSIILRATYTSKKYTNLYIFNGTGTGSYAIGSQVPIKANTCPDGMIWSHWEAVDSEGLLIPDSTAQEAIVNMIIPGLTFKAICAVIKFLLS